MIGLSEPPILREGERERDALRGDGARVQPVPSHSCRRLGAPSRVLSRLVPTSRQTNSHRVNVGAVLKSGLPEVQARWSSFEGRDGHAEPSLEALVEGLNPQSLQKPSPSFLV